MTHEQFTEDGIRLYKCLKCMDKGWVLWRGPDGQVDWSHPHRCTCRTVIESQQNLPQAHPERPSRRKR